MPTKRKSTPKGTTARKAMNNKKSMDQYQNLSLLLTLLNEKLDQGFDTLNRKIDAVDKKVDAVDQKVDAHRQETAAEFKAVRGEMAQGLDAVRGEMAQGLDAVRGEMAQDRESVRGEMARGFESQKQELKAELQKQFEKYGADTYRWYTRLDDDNKALDKKFSANQNQLLTAMDASAKEYENFQENRDKVGGEIRELQNEVKELKKRDMEKAAAIERIENQLKAA